MSRGSIPQVSFADVEFMKQGIFLEPHLQAISNFLDQHEAMIEKVRGDLERGLKNPATGRSGLTPSQVLRSLILMRVKDWDYRELRERIADGYTLRSFTDFLSQPVPKHDAFNRAFNRLTPETLQAVNEFVVRAAVDLGLEDGKKLRVDSTVVQTDIHHPTDNTLLWDTVRLITRLVGQLDQAVRRGLKGFRNRTRAARRRMQEIQRMTAKQRQQQQTKKYRQLIEITEQLRGSAVRFVNPAEMSYHGLSARIHLTADDAAVMWWGKSALGKTPPVYGPYLDLPAGRWWVTLLAPDGVTPADPGIIVDVVHDSGRNTVRPPAPIGPRASFEILLDRDVTGTEVRMYSGDRDHTVGCILLKASTDSTMPREGSSAACDRLDALKNRY